MEGFEYETAIKDSMSAPAHAEAAALGDLEGAIKKTDAALHGSATAHEHAGHAAHEHAGFLNEFTHSLVGEIAIGELAAEGVKKLGEAFLEFGEHAIEFAEEGVQFALEAAEFKENMITAFTVVSGTAEEGEETYAQIERIASAQHLNIEKSAGLAKELALSGVENTEQLSATVSAIGALQRTGLEAGAEKVRRLIEQSEAAGHLVLPKKLGAVGFNVDALANALGETPKQFAADLKAGKVSVEHGIEAIDDVINNGKVGQLAARKFDLTDVATDWANVWRKLVEDVDAGPLTASLRNFVAIFDDGQSAGGALKDELVSDVNTIIRVLGQGVEDVETFALEIELGFLKGKNAARPMIDEIERLSVNGPSLETIGGDVAWIAEELTKGAVSAAWFAAELYKIQGWLGHAGAEALGAGGHESAEGFVAGLVGGMVAGDGPLVEAAADLGRHALAALREVWDSHSPSRVAFEIGAGIGEGTALGAESSAARAADAVSGALGVPDLSRGGSGSIAGGARSITVESGAVQIHIALAGGDMDAVREIAEEAGTDLLERIALELGG